jgi:hypothetical protein
MTMLLDLGFERLGAVRSEVERACGLLVSPSAEALDRCTGVLESACSDLETCRSWVRGAHGKPEVLAEARRLNEAVRRAFHLLEIARDYYAKWIQSWAAVNNGYNPTGETPLTVGRGLVCLTG